MSVLILPSTLIVRCLTIFSTSDLVMAYLSLFLNIMMRGNDSLSLCGPGDGRGANTPPSLSNIHDFGAAKRFKCFFGPRAFIVYKVEIDQWSVSCTSSDEVTGNQVVDLILTIF